MLTAYKKFQFENTFANIPLGTKTYALYQFCCDQRLMQCVAIN